MWTSRRYPKACAAAGVPCWGSRHYTLGLWALLTTYPAGHAASENECAHAPAQAGHCICTSSYARKRVCGGGLGRQRHSAMVLFFLRMPRGVSKALLCGEHPPRSSTWSCVVSVLYNMRLAFTSAIRWGCMDSTYVMGVEGQHFSAGVGVQQCMQAAGESCGIKVNECAGTTSTPTAGRNGCTKTISWFASVRQKALGAGHASIWNVSMACSTWSVYRDTVLVGGSVRTRGSNASSTASLRFGEPE